MEPVVIVGGGLAGLLLALLLETSPPPSTASPSPPYSPIPYTILERSPFRKYPLEGGGVIFLTPQIQSLLARLGILEAIREISRPVVGLTVYYPREQQQHHILPKSMVAGANDNTAADKNNNDDFSNMIGDFESSTKRSGERSTYPDTFCSSFSNLLSSQQDPQSRGMEGSASESAVAMTAGSEQKISKEAEFEAQDGAFVKTRYSYDTLAISRPELYNFLVDQIPEEKLILGKQVQELVFQGIAQEESSAPSLPGSEPRSMSISGHAHRVTPADAEKNGSVMTTDPSLVNERVPSRGTERSFIVCTDGTRYDGIIIGADGAYSVTRRHLYKHLREKGLLTESSLKDEENKQNRMQAQFRVLVGMTRELDPDRFELVKNVSSDVRVLVSQGDKPFMFWCVPVTGNRICWMLDELLPESFTCPDVEDFTQDQDVIQKLCESVRSIPSPCGKGISVGEIIEDLTPSGTAMLLSREEGYFSPRTHDNVALMGDSCHKALPYTGQPMAMAGRDAVQLAHILHAHSLDASLACSPLFPSACCSMKSAAIVSSVSYADPTAIDSFETAAREVNRRGTSRIEDRLRSYDVERRAEAEHAVKQAGRFARLLLQKTLDVRSGVDGSRERDEEMRDGELQRLLQELQ